MKSPQPRRHFSSWISAVLGTVVVGVLLGALYFAVATSETFALRGVPLEWAPRRLDHGKMELEISRAIEANIGATLSGVLGRRPWEVDLDSLAAKIRELPWIRDVRLQRVFPDRLLVSISPKVPIAVVMTSKDGALPLAETGELMPKWEANVVPDIPFLRGDLFIQDAEVRKKAVGLINSLPKEGILSRSNIAEINWNQGFSLILLSPRTKIILGDSQIAQKLLRVEHVLNYLSSQDKKARIIDSTSVKKVVVRPQHHS